MSGTGDKNVVVDSGSITVGQTGLGNLVTTPMNDIIAINEGYISGQNLESFISQNPTVNDTKETVWGGSGEASFPSGQILLTITGASAQDSAAGTGIQTLLIEGLDGAFNPRTETVTMNGTGGVTTTLGFFRINRLVAQTVGSNGAAVGDIVVQNTAKTQSYTYLSAGDTVSNTAHFTVPVGKTWYLQNVIVSSDSDATVQVDFEAMGAFDSVWLTQSRILTSGSRTFNVEFKHNFAVSAGTDFRARSVKTTGGTDANVVLEFIGVLSA